ncbi:V-type ATP synthase subunit F [Candidatus Woesearchaeota archaeon CG10_big_fil_rev_8_21_14_0_10_44_13]|nr:MAG: V-type ATP synthase subunit F [Candidatus Woesearchaeota archaeon CG10_big_fil_rev_8_21_14_0_10_44_13]
MELAVIGIPEFTLGFRISGIRKVFDAESGAEAAKIFREMMQDAEVGIIITDDKTIQSLDDRTREDVEISVRPVTVIVSAESTAQEALRKMILKSIGVDLWKS